ncbi:MAG TPA: winged helix DNA-binding domain-containing protein [Pyrinomonadaceae bacterium]|nr:winged helix DNA-binding domain-containing protein [Pyrinomonadaceae bacterium]
MTTDEIAPRRLRQQRIEGEKFERPEEAVAWLGAVQAQDYGGALWGVGLRLRDASEAGVERAIAERKIVRTWPMRRTLHLVAAGDVRWMLKLCTPRVVAGAARRLEQFVGLDESTFTRSKKLFERALGGGRQLTRGAMYETLESAGVPTSDGRGLHVITRLAQDGFLCFGTREGRQPTFALLDEWVPASKELEREEALAELARRYFTSHGPATLQDFAWWSGLTVADARAGVESARPRLASETAGARTYWFSASAAAGPEGGAAGLHLLPPFDEYIVAYKDRGAVLDPSRTRELNPGNGVFSPTIVSGGRVVGTWKRALKKGSVVITPAPFAPLRKAEARAFKEAARRYGDFLGLPAATT